MFLDGPVQFWSQWGLRIYVLSSLSANVLLSLVSWTRRRSAHGWRAVLLWAVARLLWLAYQLGAVIAAAGALGSLSLCGSDASAEEQKVMAFWAPLLLLHLGGPDTMTAYALEDNTLSLRKVVELLLHVLGASYALYKYIFGVGSWTLLATASAIMLPVGAARYVEKCYALWNSRRMMEDDGDSSKRKKKKKVAGGESTASIIIEKVEKLDDDDDALRRAQDLFHVCLRALADSSVARGSEKQVASEQIFELDWKSMCKVVEMELSLMYEALYTKAIVLHTCPTAGYLIRLLSPLATAAAMFFFNRYHAGIATPVTTTTTTIGGSFVDITYLLLGAALALDVVWLLRALGSTWMAPRRPAWWARCWLRLHRVVVALDWLDPMSWLLCSSDPLRHRTWSGTIGQYNLLRECCAHRLWWRQLWSWLEKKCELEDRPYLKPLPEGFKELLMERVRLVLESARSRRSKPAGYDVERNRKPYYYTMAAVRTQWGHKPFQEVEKLFFEGDGRHDRTELLLFAREFEEDALAWHIATCVFLSNDTVKGIRASHDRKSRAKVEAIEAMSQYIMFLVAVRRHMLPRLILHSMFEASLETLGEIWEGEPEEATRIHNETSTATGSPSAAAAAVAAFQQLSPEDKLADMLLRKKRNGRDWFTAGDDARKLLIYNATVIAGILIQRCGLDQERVLDFIFNVWVDKLLYAAVRCSRESHAKQLSRGGELTTILWMIAHHAGLYIVGVRKADYKEAGE